jgi:mannose-6-phosphate isomerase-like protein (cupin superfamily)
VIIRRDDAEHVQLDRYWVRDYGRSSDRSSSLTYCEVEPGGRHVKMRSPRSDRYFYIVSGRLQGQSDVQGSVELGPGDMWYVPRGEQWSYENTSGEPVVFVLCHTPPLELDVEEVED